MSEADRRTGQTAQTDDPRQAELQRLAGSGSLRPARQKGQQAEAVTEMHVEGII